MLVQGNLSFRKCGFKHTYTDIFCDMVPLPCNCSVSFIFTDLLWIIFTFCWVFLWHVNFNVFLQTSWFIQLLYHFQSVSHWENGSLLSFQIYEYINYKFTKLYHKDKENVPVIDITLDSNTFLSHHTKKSHKCTIMLLFNLAEPDWISTSSDEKLFNYILCYSYNNTEHSN